VKLQRKSGLRALTVGAVAITGALVLSACGSDDNSDGSSDSPSSSSAGSTGGASTSASSISCEKGNLLSSGSTAQQNAMELWIKNYMQACQGSQINYKGVGSGAGIQDFLQGNTAWAGSDSPLKDDEVAKSKSVCKGGQGIDLPMVGGPIAIMYNLPGVDNLVLDAPTLAKLFNNKITKWNDQAIAKLNPGVTLPDLAVQAFHRSDDSGTTDNFTKYLIATAPGDFPYTGGKAWQAKGGQAASGTSGVTAQVKQIKGGITYGELSYATSSKLSTVKIATGASAPVEATTDNASKAIAAASQVGTGSDLALQFDYKTKAEGAYPITLVTYEIACDKGNKADSLAAMKSFLTYISGEEGQGLLAAQGYAPLPDSVATKVRSTVSTLS
jgi:phosphate transport system substrate-binding protein